MNKEFCKDCADWATCKGSKWATCPYREDMNIVKNGYCWTEEDNDYIVELYNSGKLIKEIARIMDLSERTVLYQVRKLRQKGFKIDRRYKIIDWEAILPKAVEMRQSGKKFREIGEVFGISEQVVQGKISKLKKQGVLEDTDDRKNEHFYKGCRVGNRSVRV